MAIMNGLRFRSHRIYELQLPTALVDSRSDYQRQTWHARARGLVNGAVGRYCGHGVERSADARAGACPLRVIGLSAR